LEKPVKSLRLILASLSFSLAACASAHAETPTLKAPISIQDPPQVELDRAQVRAKLAERRKLAIKNFLAYRDAMVYPVNQLPGGGFRHVWFDGQNHLCAAATLISKDWGIEATKNAGKQNLELKMADVKVGPVLDWLLTSGLTRAEIVAIQVPGWEYKPSSREIEIGRLYSIYVDVERQLKSLDEQNLDLATDELMKHPALARELLAGRVAGPGKFATPPVG
jgi:hypothetical protein